MSTFHTERQVLNINEVSPELLKQMQETEEKLIDEQANQEPKYSMLVNARGAELNAVLISLALAVLSGDLMTGLQMTSRAKGIHKPFEAKKLLDAAMATHEAAKEEIIAQAKEIKQKVYTDFGVDPDSQDPADGDGKYDPTFIPAFRDVPVS